MFISSKDNFETLIEGLTNQKCTWTSLRGGWGFIFIPVPQENKISDTGASLHNSVSTMDI